MRVPVQQSALPLRDEIDRLLDLAHEAHEVLEVREFGCVTPSNQRRIEAVVRDESDERLRRIAHAIEQRPVALGTWSSPSHSKSSRAARRRKTRRSGSSDINSLDIPPDAGAAGATHGRFRARTPGPVPVPENTGSTNCAFRRNRYQTAFAASTKASTQRIRRRRNTAHGRAYSPCPSSVPALRDSRKNHWKIWKPITR